MFLSGRSIFLCNFIVLVALVSGEKYGKIANEFVVVFHPGIQEVAVEEHMDALKSHEHTIIHNYQIGSDPTKEFRGYAIRVPDEESSALKFVNSEVNSATVKVRRLKYSHRTVPDFHLPRPTLRTQTTSTWNRTQLFAQLTA
jgi:hypothetical protein